MIIITFTKKNGIKIQHAKGEKSYLATSVACGSWHTLVATASGRVFAFGDGFTGQLGLQDRGGLDESRAVSPREVQMENREGEEKREESDVCITQVRAFLF